MGMPTTPMGPAREEGQCPFRMRSNLVTYAYNSTRFEKVQLLPGFKAVIIER